jgi:hypothetical protein
MIFTVRFWKHSARHCWQPKKRVAAGYSVDDGFIVVLLQVLCSCCESAMYSERFPASPTMTSYFLGVEKIKMFSRKPETVLGVNIHSK